MRIKKNKIQKKKKKGKINLKKKIIKNKDWQVQDFQKLIKML